MDTGLQLSKRHAVAPGNSPKSETRFAHREEIGVYIPRPWRYSRRGDRKLQVIGSPGVGLGHLTLFAGPGDAGRLYLDRSAPCWRIVDIGLVPELRSSGIGTALIEGIKISAMAAGTGVALQVARDNRRARSLYLRLGFVDDGAPEGFHQPMLWRGRISCTPPERRSRSHRVPPAPRTC